MSVRKPIPESPAPRWLRDASFVHRAAGPGSLLLVMLVLSPVASAQQWFFSPEVEIAAQHIDNPRLREDGDTGGDKESITGGLLDVGAALHRNTQTTSIVVRPSAAIYRYPGDSDEDSESYFLDFDAENDGQRSNWRFGGNYQQQQVFRGETTSPEIDDDIGVDEDVQTGTGRTFERRQRDMWRLQPGFTFDLSERTAFKADINYLNVEYDRQALGAAIDYTSSRGDVAIVRALTPDSNVEFGVFASKYDPDGLRRETDSVGARVRYEKEVSDISTFFIDVGGQEADIESGATQDKVSETSFLWNVGYSRQLERTRWRFDVGQAVTPSGSGAMVERDLYRASMHHQLRPRWSFGLSAVLLNTDALGREEGDNDIDRDYLQSRATLGYEMTRNWTVEGRYSFTHQDFADIPGDAQEHEVRLSLIYRRPVPTT